VNCCSNTQDAVPPASTVETPALETLSAPMVSVAPGVLAPAQGPAEVAMLAELGPPGWLILAGLAAWWLFGGRRK
jgi:hypothetical protein